MVKIHVRTRNRQKQSS